MIIAIKCAKCGAIFLQEDKNELTLEFDFREKQIRFICRAKGCNHENVIDFGDWGDKQKKSPLPPIRIM